MSASKKQRTLLNLSKKIIYRLLYSEYRIIIIISIFIGIVSGIGSIIFIEALKFLKNLFFYNLIGFDLPVAEKFVPTKLILLKPYFIPISTAIGGIISGFLVYKFAPEAEGHGTDAAIAAFHRFAGRVRKRVPLIKLIASSFTISSGGSAGREGPMAQIGAGIGSYVADLLKARTYIRRLAVAIGIGAGIGTIFKAPLGGAIFGMEVVYKKDFEVEALLPAFIASVIGYTIFGVYAGYTPLFDIPQTAFNHPMEILFYVILGILTAIFGILYVKIFYKTRDIFRGIRIPNIYKPFIGGATVGFIGILFPTSLGTGYGWLPYYTRNIFPAYNFLSGKWIYLNNWIILVIFLYLLAFIKILVTALTIGSGGSGGVFAPGLSIGAFVGAASSITFMHLFPKYIMNPNLFLASSIIIGMMSLFGAVSKSPIAVLIMVSEMTGSYGLIGPAMLSIAISYILSGEYTIYPEQMPDRAHSPAHIREYHKMILEELHVKNVMKTSFPAVSPITGLRETIKIMMQRGLRQLPVVENNRLLGVVCYEDIKQVSKDKKELMPVLQIMRKRIIVVYPDETLFEALRKMTKLKVELLPVVDKLDSKKIIGIITKKDVAQAHDKIVSFLIEEEMGEDISSTNSFTEGE